MSEKNNVANASMKSNRHQKERDYWLTRLSDFPSEKTAFPYDFSKPSDHDASEGFVTDKLEFQFPGDIRQKLAKLSNNSDLRLFIILEAALVILLSKYTGTNDITVGTSVVRQEVEAEFINTLLILRHQFHQTATFKDLLMQARQTIMDATEHVNYPIRMLLYQLQLPMEKDGFPLFDVIVLLENLHDKDYIKDIKTNMRFLFHNCEDAIHCTVIDGTVDYNPAVFDRRSVENIIQHFYILLGQCLDNVNLELSGLELLTAEEKEQLADFNSTRTDYPTDKTIHRLFEEQAARTPLNIAVRDESGNTLTYSQLDERASGIAADLNARGIKKGSIVAISFERSVEAVVTILGILKAGAAYLYIDPEYPESRRNFIMADSNAALLIRQPGSQEPAPPLKAPVPDDPSASPSDLAYVLYTSGSTGQPKGVMVEHRGLVNYISWAARNYVNDETVNFPLYSSLSFDLTVTSIYVPLVTGNTIVIYNGENNLMLEKIIADRKVEAVKLTPSHLKLMGEALKDNPGSTVKRLIVGGEKFETSLARQTYDSFDGNVEIYNEYGPTEAVVGCMLYRWQPGDDSSESVPIGVPVHNMQIYLLDPDGRPVPPGAFGEIYISGHGIARGYINNPQLTQEKFVETRHFSHLPHCRGRLYRTGDLARQLPDGNIVFRGRIDQQIKIRGYRIEPGEIENHLLACPQIKGAAVSVVHPDDSAPMLCAYVAVTGETDLDPLREYLLQRLPDYMIPSYFQRIDTIPLTPNGKVDYKALPPVELDSGSAPYKAPGTPREKMLVDIWESILGVENVGINDNFFMTGGDSIKAIQLMSRLTGSGYKVRMRDLFQYPRISQLAPVLNESTHSADQETVSGNVPLTPIQHWFFDTIRTQNHHFNQSLMLFSREPLSKESLESIFTKLQTHHDALRMTFKQGESILQVNPPDAPPFTLDKFDYRGQPDAAETVTRQAAVIQAGIDLENGPLIRAALFHMDDDCRLLMVIHHLVIDGVSWRILLEDLDTLYRRYTDNQPLSLPLKTDSYKVWSRHLENHANEESFLKEKTFWKELESRPAEPIPTDFQVGDNLAGDTHRRSFQLETEPTRQLLTRANEPFSTETNDLLLTALASGIQKTFRIDRICLDLEGHGREDLFSQIDISRTVGWFTSVYPVLFDLSPRNPHEDASLSHRIIQVKEYLRNIPNRGIGYGILKYLTHPQNKQDIQFNLNPTVSFNYLGQFDSDIANLAFEVAKESTGPDQSPRSQQPYQLVVTCSVSQNRLELSVTFNKNQYKPQTIDLLLENVRSGLLGIVEHCISQPHRTLTPSDMTYGKLSISALNQLTRRYAIEDIYPLTPMQKGMLFHSVYPDSGPSAYWIQTTYRLNGDWDIQLVQTSFRQLVDRHEILRAVFIHKNIETPLQVVLKERPAEFTFRDFRHLAAVTEKEAALTAFKEEGRASSIDLETDPLMRLAAFRLDETQYEFTWSFHHILMDGWCMGILMWEFLEIYNSLLKQRTPRLKPAAPYGTYIRWLDRQDNARAGDYWSRYLEGYDSQAAIPKLDMPQSRSNIDSYRQINLIVTEEDVKHLNAIAGQNQATLNSLIQAVWSIVLGAYCGRKDVVSEPLFPAVPLNWTASNQWSACLSIPFLSG